MCLAESISLKEIAGLWSVTVLDYLYVVTGGSKLHSSTPNISISTLLKILLNRQYSQGSLQFSTPLSFSKTISNYSLLNFILARMLLVSNLSVLNVGSTSLLITYFIKDILKKNSSNIYL